MNEMFKTGGKFGAFSWQHYHCRPALLLLGIGVSRITTEQRPNAGKLSRDFWQHL